MSARTTGVTLVEWADRLDAALDADRLTIRIVPDGETVRMRDDSRRTPPDATPPTWTRPPRWAAMDGRDAAAADRTAAER